MKIFTYSEARQNLAKLLALAQTEEVEIRRKDGSVFSLAVEKPQIKVAIRRSRYQCRRHGIRYTGCDSGVTRTLAMQRW